MTVMLAIRALLGREVRHFVRRPSHIIAALATPAVIWLMIGGGLAGSITLPAPGGGSGEPGYTAFLLPGVALLVCVFSSIVSAMGLIEDKHSAWMRSVMLSPQPRVAIVLSRLIAAVLLACAQAVLVLVLGPVVGLGAGISSYALAVCVLVLVAASASGFALGAAWLIGTTRGFHGIVNLVLLPAWMLSGAVFPIDGAAGWMRVLAAVNPLAWAHTVLDACLYRGVPPPVLPVFLLFGAAVGSVVFAAWCVGRRG